VKVSFAVMRPEKYEAQVQVSDEDLRARYEANKSAFQLPERRGLLIFPVEEAAVAATLTISDDQLRKAYAEQIERFRTPERVRVRHILVATTDKSDAEKAKLRKKAEGLLQQLKGGADFAKLATENSDDPGSAQKGGDLDWVVRGQTVPEFEKTAFELKPGQLSEIVTTMFGYHILKVEAHEQGRVKPLEEVKNDLKADLMRAQVFDRMQLLADQIRAALTRSAAEAEALAKANGITPSRVAPMNMADPVPGVGADANFRDAVSSLPQGGVTQPIPAGTNRLVIAQVTTIVPPEPAKFEDVRAQLRAQIVRERAATIFEDRLKEAAERVRLAGGDLASVAKSMGLELKTQEVARTDDLEGIGTARQIEEAFTRNPGDFFGPVRITGGALLVKVLEKKAADLTGLAAQREALTQQIKRQRAQERQELFKEGILNELIREKKVKVYDENVQRLTERFSKS
jgi:peptidyl-prolyl cis-trans isomerase D